MQDTMDTLIALVDEIPKGLRPQNMDRRSWDAEGARFPSFVGRVQEISPAEKKWLCQEICGEHDVMSNFIHQSKYAKRKFSCISVEETFGVSRNTVCTWLKKFKKNGGKNFHDEAVRPLDIDDIAVNEIINEVKDKRLNGKLFRDELAKLMVKGRVDTCRRRAKIVNPKAFDKRSVDTFINRYSLTNLKSQPRTAARNKSAQCPRVTYVWACTLLAFAGHLVAAYKFCGDATTIKVMKDRTDAFVVTLVDDDGSTTRVQSDTCIFVKWFYLSSGEGESARIFLIISVDGLPEDVYQVYKVFGLCSTAGVGSVGDYGFVAFVHSRDKAGGLWDWYFQDFAVPEMSRAMACRNFTVSTHPKHSLFIIACY
jgi:transposase